MSEETSSVLVSHCGLRELHIGHMQTAVMFLPQSGPEDVPFVCPSTDMWPSDWVSWAENPSLHLIVLHGMCSKFGF